jgi:hypothetical protein
MPPPAALAQGAEQGQQRHTEDGEVITNDLVEQRDSEPLHAEHADAIADLGPFGVEIGGDEFFRERADMQDRLAEEIPLEEPPRAKATALSRCIVRPEKKRRCPAASLRLPGLENRRLRPRLPNRRR